MVSYRRLIPLVVLSILGGRCLSLTPTELSNLYTTIFTNYDTHLLPLTNQSGAATVSTMFGIFSINGFDEISGILSLSVLLVLIWKEERISWNPGDYENKSSLYVRPGDIWHPQVYLYETADQVANLANTSVMPRIQYDGSVTWTVGMVVRSSCSVDVTYFPFDTQVCILSFGTNSYLPSELKFISVDSTINTVAYMSNSQWTFLESSFVKNGSGASTDSSIQVTVHLERRAKFYVVYIIVPTIFLSILNILVFVMPKDSGERLGVATTMILAFVVYMDIVNSNVPASSEPMSFFYFYLLFLVVYSSCIMFLCVISLRIHSNMSEVPSKLQSLVRLLDALRCSKSNTGSTVRPTSQTQHEHIDDIVDDLDKEHTVEEPVKNKIVPADGGTELPNTEGIVGWGDVGRIFDICCLVFLGTVNVIISGVSIDIIINRWK